MKTTLPRLTEREFMRQVLQLAKLCGWRTFHVRPGRTLKGWRTAYEGDGMGFPDLLAIRGSDVIVAELKVGTNVVTPEQAAWLAAFDKTAVRWFVWTPDCWPEIEEVLRG